MSEVTLPTRAAAPPSHQAAGSTAPGTVSDPPAGVLRLAPGSLLHGVVTGQNKQGQLLVRTDAGVLAVATKLALPLGREVSLQIRSAGSQLHITIVPLDGEVPLEARPPTPAQPAPPAGSLPGDARASGDLGSIREPPPAATRLPAGSLLPATVIERATDGGFLLRSELGTLHLNTGASLQPGSKLALQVQSLVPDLQVAILPRQPGPDALAGRPAPAGGQAATLGAASGGAQANSGSAPQALGHVGPTVDVLAVGRPVQAIVLAPTPAQGAAAQVGPAGAAQASLFAVAAKPSAAIRSLPVGSALEVRIQQIAPPTGGAAAPGTQGAAQAAGGGTVQPPHALLAALSGLAPERLAAATDLVAASRGSEAPHVLQGRVIGAAANGQPILQTSVGTLQLSVKTALPHGTRLLLTLPDGLDLPEALSRPTPAAMESESLARRWPALQGLLTLLDEVGPSLVSNQASQQQAGPSVPQPGPKLASGLLFFLNALSGGDPGAWLDGLLGSHNAARLESMGQGSLLARLRGDMARLAGQSEAAGPEWRFLPVPFFDGQALQQLRFFFRQHGDQDGQDGSGGGSDTEATRFLLDVELTRLGALQFDGLIQPKRFDMILRSHQALPDWMQLDILKIFENANEAAGSSGQLRFHAANDWSPLAVALEPAEADGLVV